MCISKDKIIERYDKPYSSYDALKCSKCFHTGYLAWLYNPMAVGFLLLTYK